MTDADPPHGLTADIIEDLAGGQLLDLAELYAVGALGSQGESAVDEFLRSAPPALRAQFTLRVSQTYEALTLTYGSLDADPPPNLLPRLLAMLPSPHPGP